MKALIMKEYMKLECIDVDIPKLKADEVLVKIMAASVCGSDINGIDGKSGRRQVPIIMGHEASGVIADIGANVSKFKIGDRVTFDSTIYCGYCDYCNKGQVNLCDNRKVLGVSCDDYRQNGTYSEYVAIPYHIIYKIKDNVRFQDAALVEPMSVALHAVNLLEIESSDVVLILGTGTIALFVVQFLKIRKPKKIIVVGRNSEKLNLAKNLGADEVINSSEEYVSDAIIKLTNSKGVDKSIDAAGSQITFSCGIESLRKGGTFVTLANLDKTFNLNIGSVITKQLTIKGSCASSGEYNEILNLLSEGLIRTDYVISKEITLSEAGDYIVRLHKKEIPNFNKLIITLG